MCIQKYYRRSQCFILTCLSLMLSTSCCTSPPSTGSACPPLIHDHWSDHWITCSSSRVSFFTGTDEVFAREAVQEFLWFMGMFLCLWAIASVYPCDCGCIACIAMLPFKCKQHKTSIVCVPRLTTIKLNLLRQVSWVIACWFWHLGFRSMTQARTVGTIRQKDVLQRDRRNLKVKC